MKCLLSIYLDLRCGLTRDVLEDTVFRGCRVDKEGRKSEVWQHDQEADITKTQGAQDYHLAVGETRYALVLHFGDLGRWWSLHLCILSRGETDLSLAGSNDKRH